MSAFAEYAGAVPGLMLAGCRGAGLLFVAPGVSSPLVPGVVRVLFGVIPATHATKVLFRPAYEWN